MKIKKAVKYVFLWALAAVAYSCTEAPIGQTPTSSTPPSPLTDVKAEALPGGAKITYVLPNETDISYVMGEYLSQGKKMVVRASALDDYLIIEGLAGVEPVTVTLWLVGHSENKSKPATVTFTPETAPIENVFASVAAKPDFGGISLTWENTLGIEVGVILYALKSDGGYDNGRAYFSVAKEGKVVYRGLDPVENKFGVQIIDRWGHTTELKEFTLTPILERRVDRTKIKQYRLPWDNTSDDGASVWSYMFDGEKLKTEYNSWHTRENQPLDRMGFTVPILFTLDLGEEIVLNRFMLWQGNWSNSFRYAHHNLRFFEVWGTSKPAEGRSDNYWLEDWKDDWTMLGDLELVRPSGLPLGTPLTDEDVAQAIAGHNFDLLIKDPVRYVRFSVKSTWVGSKDNAITINELEFYGGGGN